MKPADSRAIAVQTIGGFFPPARRAARYREDRRACAFQAISRILGGAYSSLYNLLAPTWRMPVSRNFRVTVAPRVSIAASILHSNCIFIRLPACSCRYILSMEPPMASCRRLRNERNQGFTKGQGYAVSFEGSKDS